MGVITQADLYIDGISGFHNISSFTTKNVPGEHPVATITGEVSSEYDIASFSTSLQSQKIKIRGANESGRSLFVGYVNEIEIIEEGKEYYTFRLSLIGVSSKLDYEKLSRSFQDVSMTYGDVIKQVANEQSQVTLTCNLPNDKAIGMPVIQYNETNWEFIKRLASHLNASVLVDDTRNDVSLTIGAEYGSSAKELGAISYTTGFSSRYYEVQGCSSSVTRAKFTYIKVKNEKSLAIGSSVTFDGKIYIVSEKEGSLEKKEFYITYTLTNKHFLFAKTKYNHVLAGLTIQGSVVKTKCETLELDLQLKDEKKSSVRYAYDWVPESGNVMYCMPKIGTKVSLYFPSADEKSAIVTNCIRENGGQSQIFDPDVKTFVTENQKMLCLSEEAMHFITDQEEEKIAQLSMLDEQGCFLVSYKGIKISAAMGLIFSSDKIRFSAVTELDFLQSDDAASHIAYIIQNYEFDVSADIIKIACKLFDSYPMINDAPQQVRSSASDIFKHVLVGLFAVAAVTAAAIAICVTAGAAGPVIVGAAMGAASAGAFKVFDMAKAEANGEAMYSVGDYLVKVGVTSVVGAITGAVSGAASGIAGQGVKKAVAEFAADQIGNAVSTIADNIIEQRDWNEGLGLSMAVSLGMSGAGKLCSKVAGSRAFQAGADKLSQCSGVVKVKNAYTAVKDKFGVEKVSSQVDNLMDRRKNAAVRIEAERQYIEEASDRVTQVSADISRSNAKIIAKETELQELKQQKQTLTRQLAENSGDSTLRNAKAQVKHQMKNCRRSLEREEQVLSSLTRSSQELTSNIGAKTAALNADKVLKREVTGGVWKKTAGTVAVNVPTIEFMKKLETDAVTEKSESGYKWAVDKIKMITN